MDRALSRRYLKAMGVVLWRPRDAFEAELAAEPAAAASAAPVVTAPVVTAPVEPARPGHRPVTPATRQSATTGPGRSGIAAARAALGEQEPRAPRPSATSRQDQIPPTTPIASAAPPEPPAFSVQPGAPAVTAGAASTVTAMDWPELESEVSNCQRCGLCEQRNRTVFGTGNRHATLMLVGEAPGKDEDLQGEPFVGRAGQLLTLMLEAIDLPREQVYIGNIIKCRPPNNRDPEPQEIAACRAFIERQIALINPRLLLCLGRVSAQALLQTTEAVGRLRGRWHSFGADEIPLLVTYHPSYYLRAPAEKARGWEDLQRVAQRLKAL